MRTRYFQENPITKILSYTTLFLVCIVSLVPTINLQAQTQATLLDDVEYSYKAEITNIINQENKISPGLGLEFIQQELELKIIKGDEKGRILKLTNDRIPYAVGDTLYVKKIVRGGDGREVFIIGEPNRLPILIIVTLAFILTVIVFGGIQGVRGLISLIGSLGLIVYVLLPGTLGGISPITLTLVVSSAIIIIGSYITHGFNRTTSSAVVGMIGTICFTGYIAHKVVLAARLTGFESDESIYLNMATNGSLDFVGLLFSGILIGLLGVLYDVAIGQAVSVEELHRANPHMSRYTVYTRAVRIGREHIGALVNTLAIAYVGASLPLLLLLYSSSITPLEAVNKEIFATEIVRTMIGSIGLVIAVPITTFISVLMLMGHALPSRSHTTHHHTHGH